MYSRSLEDYPLKVEHPPFEEIPPFYLMENLTKATISALNPKIKSRGFEKYIVCVSISPFFCFFLLVGFCLHLNAYQVKIHISWVV